MSETKILGFIGLGVMGEPICSNITRTHSGQMHVFDLKEEPLKRLTALGATRAGTIADIAKAADMIFLSLPGGNEVAAVMRGPDGLLENGRAGQIIVDLSTCPVGLTRELQAEAAQKGIEFADAPVARTRQAAIDGTLSIMVGCEEDLFARIRPYLAAAAEEITHCGGIGTGQVMKLMNNMVLFQTVVALSEAMVTAERAGVSRETLIDVLSLGSADSFALRNHGRKAMMPNRFPLAAFATDYALKDITYALELAHDFNVPAASAELAKKMLERSSAAGFGAEYFPVLINQISGMTRADYDASLEETND